MDKTGKKLESGWQREHKKKEKAWKSGEVLTSRSGGENV